MRAPAVERQSASRMDHVLVINVTPVARDWPKPGHLRDLFGEECRTQLALGPGRALERLPCPYCKADAKNSPSAKCFRTRRRRVEQRS